jgi:hypothetical protein
MAQKTAYIVAANNRYLPGLNAVLNSLDMVGNKDEVYCLVWNIPQEYLDRASKVFDFPIVWEKLTADEIQKYGEGEVLMRKRYLIPALMQYDAVCILDADMFFCHNTDRYMEIAAKTDLVLGCTLEQKRRYAEANHEVPPGSGNYLIPKDFWNGRDLCCAPLFCGPRWYPALKRTWDIFAVDEREKRFRAPDMDALNICLIEAGAYDHIIPLSQHTWTGLHECLMKAHTRAIDLHGRPFTEDGEEINIIHGQYWNATWRGWQIENQLGMVRREFDASPGYLSRSKGSFETILRWYEERSVHHKININDFLQSIESRAPAASVMEIT